MNHLFKESPRVHHSKRFALKKEICDLKTFKKFYKQYQNKNVFHFIERKHRQEEREKCLEDIKDLSQQVDSQFQVSQLEQQSTYAFDFDDKQLQKISQIEKFLLRSQDSAKTKPEKMKPKKLKKVGLKFDSDYEEYLLSLFDENKQQLCSEWLKTIMQQ